MPPNARHNTGPHRINLCRRWPRMDNNIPRVKTRGYYNCIPTGFIVDVLCLTAMAFRPDATRSQTEILIFIPCRFADVLAFKQKLISSVEKITRSNFNFPLCQPHWAFNSTLHLEQILFDHIE